MIETATKMPGAAWGDEGTSRVQHAWTVDPGIARSLQAGQAAYIAGGGCTWIQIARPRPSPLALPAPPPAPPVIIPPATAPAEREPSPDGPAPLDDAFGAATEARP